MSDRRKALSRYLRENGFEVGDRSGRAVLQGVKARSSELSDVVWFVQARDGGTAVETLVVGVRVNKVDAAFEDAKMRTWTVPAEAELRRFSAPSRMALHTQVPVRADAFLEALCGALEQYRQRFREPNEVRSEVIRRKGFGEIAGRPVFDKDWVSWISAFDEIYGVTPNEPSKP